MDAVPNWFRGLYETTGYNFTVFYDPYDWDRYVNGLKTTLLLAVTTILASLVIGAVGDFQFDQLADARFADAREAERGQRMFDRLALRIEYAVLERHDDAEFHGDCLKSERGVVAGAMAPPAPAHKRRGDRAAGFA